MLAALRRWLFDHRRAPTTDEKLWQVLVQSEGKTYKIGSPFRASMEDAKAEARERGECFIAEMVIKKGGVVFAQYGIEEVVEN